MKAITIVLADDHHVVRQGLRALLEGEPRFTVVGEAATGLEAIALVERLQPAVLVVDLMMPNLNGLEVTRQVSQRVPRTRTIILSMYASHDYVQEALLSGASGYVLKGSDAADLIRAVSEVAAGLRYLSPPLSQQAIEAYLAQARTETHDSYETLTTREREVLQLVVEGHSNTDIATQLSISPRTVESHRASMMRKLGLQSQTDLIRYAIRQGIIPWERE